MSEKGSPGLLLAHSLGNAYTLLKSYEIDSLSRNVVMQQIHASIMSSLVSAWPSLLCLICLGHQRS